MVLFKLAHKDSNLEMTESESVALPFGDGPLFSQQTVLYIMRSYIASIFLKFYDFPINHRKIGFCPMFKGCSPVRRLCELLLQVR